MFFFKDCPIPVLDEYRVSSKSKQKLFQNIKKNITLKYLRQSN